MEPTVKDGGGAPCGSLASELRPHLNRAAPGPIQNWIAAHFPRASPDRYSFLILTRDGPPVAIPAQDAALHGVGCLQDVMLAALTIRLEERGLLSLEDPLTDHLPGFLPCEGVPVRLGHLLSRSSGLWMPDPAHLAAPLSNWEDFRSFVGRLSPRFTPGIVAAHSLLERIVLLRILETVLARDPYEAMRAEFWPAESSVEFHAPGGPFRGCFRQVQCTLGDLARFLASPLHEALLGRLATARSARYADPSHTIKDWAPKVAALGLYRMENGFWGQDGDDPRSGNLAMRIDPESGTIVLGRFATSVERDFLLGLVSADLFGLPKPERDVRLGSVAGFAPEELAGAYEGMLGKAISIVVEDGGLYVVGLAAGDGALPLNCRPDGTMHSRWAGQTLWIEPVRLPGSGQLALHFGRHLYLKVSGAD